ncbi:unnamed protein product [Miscanthus lutarioriparius]|uniref:Neprosin PEP catalytic domain-containing protein n=1 Tax=Miscanthus lutarioriparius TaxID=422564 RepID=A0A811SCH2_9POAL|nr:unnamed protein product [Miscanthus lutarioriparius]
MSDNATVVDSLAMRHALGRCNVDSGCNCASHSASPLRSPAAGSPSRSHSARSEDGDSVDLSEDRDSEQMATSQDQSDSSIPDGVHETDWFGMHVVRIRKCEHGRYAILKKCWGWEDRGGARQRVSGGYVEAPGADAYPEVFGRPQKLHSPINETTTNLIRGFIDHVCPRLDSAVAGGAADPTYFAFHGAEATPDGYYGFIATLDDDGFTKTGCLNTECAGFQPEKGAAIAPGDVIENVSTPKGGNKQNLSLKIVKQGGASGDWVVHAGLNREPAPIGRFPRSLFTGGFAEKAAAVRFGGMVTAPAADNPPAPMGSGYLPGASAASVTGVQLVGPDGRASPVTSDLPKLEGRPEAYAVSPVENGSFYGGPAKAVA